MAGGKIEKKFDLITVKAKNFELPGGVIHLSVSSGDIDPSTLETIMLPVYSYLNDYRKTAITPAIEKYDKKLGVMRDAKKAAELESLVNKELRNLVGNLQKEADRRIQAGWDKLKKENRAYTTFKIKIGVKITVGIVKIGKGIAALISSAGARADEYFRIAKSVVGIAKEIKKGLDTEEKAREQLKKSLEGLARAKKGDKVGESHIKEVKNAITFYNIKLTPIRQDAQKLAGSLQKLLELGDRGAEITKKQEKQINEMIEQAIKFNENEKIGRSFAKGAEKIIENVEGTLDLKTVTGYEAKLKKAYGIARKVFSAAAEIL
ncbi:MAG: hypothetical protein ACOWYE_11465 [Desulfatiglandales bacterium]